MEQLKRIVRENINELNNKKTNKTLNKTDKLIINKKVNTLNKISELLKEI